MSPKRPTVKSAELLYQKENSKLIHSFFELLEKDEIPFVWKQQIGKLCIACEYYADACDKERQRQGGLLDDISFPAAGDLGITQNLLRRELKRVDWYISKARSKLKRRGRTIRDVIGKARGNSAGSQIAFFDLIGTEPRWLYEPWVQEKILSEAFRENRSFFSQLGSSIGNSNKKAFTPVPSKSTKELLDHIPVGLSGTPIFPLARKARGEPALPKNYRELFDQLGELDLKFFSDSEQSEDVLGAFRKLLSRHGISSNPK